MQDFMNFSLLFSLYIVYIYIRFYICELYGLRKGMIGTKNQFKKHFKARIRSNFKPILKLTFTKEV